MKIKEVYCKCGCGKRIGHQKAKKGRVFLNKKHSALFREMQKRQDKPSKIKKEVKRIKIDYKYGTNYCKKYNDDDIKCVMCYEQDLKSFKTCKE